MVVRYIVDQLAWPYHTNPLLQTIFPNTFLLENTSQFVYRISYKLWADLDYDGLRIMQICTGTVGLPKRAEEENECWRKLAAILHLFRGEVNLLPFCYCPILQHRINLFCHWIHLYLFCHYIYFGFASFVLLFCFCSMFFVCKKCKFKLCLMYLFFLTISQ